MNSQASALLRDAQPHYRFSGESQPQLSSQETGGTYDPRNVAIVRPGAAGALDRKTYENTSTKRSAASRWLRTDHFSKGGNRHDAAGFTEKLLDIKREKGWTWKYICEQIGGMSPVMITGGVLGQQKMTKPMAAAAAKLFGLYARASRLCSMRCRCAVPARRCRRQIR